jgi:hypothetical protein
LNPYRENPDHIDRASCIPIEERIMASACRIRAERKPAKRRVLVSYAAFFGIVRRMDVPVHEGAFADYIAVVSPAGRLWITPSPDIVDDDDYRFEHREVLS